MYQVIALLTSLLFSKTALANDKLSIATNALLHSPETLIASGLILLAIIYFHFFKFDRFAVVHGPEILTTMGIFGCFIGIAWALLNFNNADLNTSIPMLLEGIKTAFGASVVGVFGALTIKFRHSFTKKPIPQASGTPKAASLDDMIDAMFKLQKGLVGNEEGTLLSQIKLLRNDIQDHLKKLQNSFDNFATHMVDNNQKAIVEALEKVIRDFNKNLTGQFGENFKHLNAGVEKLVIWQVQYKEELNLIQNIQTQTANDMKIAADALSSIVERSKDFTKTASDLKILLEAMDKQKEILFEQEKALAELLFQMKDIAPQFATNLTIMLDQITLGVQKIQSETTDIVKNFGYYTQSANAEMKNLLADVIHKSQQQLSSNLKESADIVKESVLTLDKQLQTELNNSLTSLGRQLAALSEKFTEDYLPLTNKLREIVQLAAKIERT